MKVNLLDFDLQGLIAHSATMGERAFRAQQLMRWIHRAGESDFGNMTNLLTLDLSNNALSGSFPVSISSLQWIWSVDLSSNRFTGELPTTLGAITSLRCVRVRVRACQCV
jgi:Leucine-rich repeat (LRR) protein